MHSNLHHTQLSDLPHWYEHIAKIMDFWPIAYYPFYMCPTQWNLGVEDRYSDEIISKDWEYLREFTENANKAGYPMFMGYEWQGNGEDGDHNVFFLGNDRTQNHPLRYSDLVESYRGAEAIGVPHHMAYQPGSRGKNWDTHNEAFSPVAEIYSCHGCSETDDGPLAMTRHIHMGPRTGQTTYEQAVKKGLKVGVIAAGDNHSVPAVFEHGSMCVLAEDNSKEAIWRAIKARRTVAVSQSRIAVDFSIDETVIGGEIAIKDKGSLKLHVEGTNAVDRVEILKDDILDEMVVHSGSWEKLHVDGIIRFKFRLEFGWGPDTRVYKDISVKQWNGKLEVPGKLLDVEKCWNNFGQELRLLDDSSCEFDLTTYKSTATGKWMGPSNVTTEGFIFHVEADADSTLLLTVDGKGYSLAVRDILESSRVVPLWDEIEQLTRETWGEVTHYRTDPWWHNAYKFKLSRGAAEAAYTVDFQKEIAIDKDCCYRLRVWQKNGDVAWTSPIFITKVTAE